LLAAPLKLMVAPAPDATPPEIDQVKGAGEVIVIEPFVPEVGILAEAASVAATLETVNAAVLAPIPVATFTATVATTPLWTLVEFKPKRTQSTQPALFAHIKDLPAAVAAGPARTVTELMEDIGYDTRHCMLVGSAPPAGVAVRFTLTVPPG
jgi:hypothetical protein